MRKQRWSTVWLFGGMVACFNLPIVDSSAQSYPVKPIRMVVGFGAGGGTDVAARMIAQKLSELLGQTILVENRTGATGTIATERVVTSPPDGYTLLLMSSAETIQPALRKLPYDIERDLAPVSIATVFAYLLVVHPSVPARNVKELIALARSQPGKLSYGTSGVGSASHVSGELFNLMAKVKIIAVPYRGGGAASVVATAAGEVDMSIIGITAAPALIEAGKLRPLAVTSAKRAALMPSIPTINESGLPGYDRPGWNAVFAPAAVPKDIIMRLNAAITKVVNTSEMMESLNKQGLEPQTNTPEQLAAFIRNEIQQNAKLAKVSGMKPE